MKTITALLLFALSLSAEGTITCTGCIDGGPIPGTAFYGRPNITFTVADLADEAYRVDLSFLEWVYNAPKKRPISVAINDQQLLKAFDVFAAGGWLQIVTRSFVALPIGGKITVAVSNDLGNSAILSKLTTTRWRAADPTPPPPPVPPPSSGGDDTFSRQFKVTRTAPAQLNMAGGNVGIDGITFGILGGTIGALSGTGTVRLGITTGATPYGQVYASPGLATTCSGMNGCTAPIVSQTFAPGDVHIAVWTVTNGTFDTNGYTDLRAPIGTGAQILPGAGMLVIPNGHTTRVGVNPAVVPVQ